MGTMEKDKTTRYLNWLMGLLGIFVLIGLIVSCMYRNAGNRGFHINQGKGIEAVFDVKWGRQEIHTTLPATIDNPDMEPVYITTVLDKTVLDHGDSIMFRNRQGRAKVYLENKLIFDSGTIFKSPFSLGYGSFWKSAEIGDDYEGKKLTIELQPGYSMKAVSGYIPAVYFGTQDAFVVMIFKRVFWALCLTLFLIVLGIYDIVYGIFSIHKKRASAMLFLGLFSIDTGIWMLIECHILEMFMKNLQHIVYLSYFTYGMMPVLLLRFLLYDEEFKDKVYLKTICLIGIALNFVQLLMAMTGICSQFESQWLNRVYLILTVIGLLNALFSVYRDKERQKKNKLHLAVFILVISTILELVNFLFISKENSGTILMLGMTVFIFKSGIDLIIEGRKLRKDDLEKEVLKTMAYTDGLTHLGNRFAYELEKDRLEKQKDSHITILIADMNGLKQANDNYGHTYGDEIICDTAELLKAAFANVGKCYRIGGDEFCILAENVNEVLFQKCIKNMRERSSEIHKQVNDYGIAYGVANGSSQEIEDIFHKADNLMYACKKEMKKTKIEVYK